METDGDVDAPAPAHPKHPIGYCLAGSSIHDPVPFFLPMPAQSWVILNRAWSTNVLRVASTFPSLMLVSGKEIDSEAR